MKKISTVFLCFLILYILIGCKNKPTIDNITPIEPKRPEEVKDLPYDPFELFKYVKENINKQDTENKSLYLLTLEDSLIQNLSVLGNIVTQADIELVLNENFDKELLYTEDLENLSETDIRKELTKITNSGYLLQKNGTQYIPTINYETLLSFDKNINPALKEYFEMKNKDVYEPVLIAGKIVAEPMDILNRLISIENFIDKYPAFERNFDLIARYQSWLYLLLTGTISTPVTDEYGKLKLVYNTMLDNIEKEQNISCAAVKKGFYILQNNDYNYDDKTSEELRAIVRDNTEKLKEITEIQ